MIRRLATLVRRAVGLALLAFAAWWAAEALAAWFAFRWLGEPAVRVAVDADTGQLYGFQVSPLTPSQRQAAIDRERALAAELLGA